MAEAITCPAAQFDRVWDAGIADWLASGAQAILNERAAKYAAPR
jgi:putative aldouronate transport system substrate-binding protein